MLWFKRIILTALLATAGGILIWGPRQGVKAPEGFTVVTYWEKWTGKEAEQMKEIVDDFNSTIGKEKRIYVQFLSMSSVNQKTLVATAAGSPPDIAGLWDYQVAQFAALDALEPLDHMAAEHGISQGYYKPVYWNGCLYQGQLYALVSTPWVVALHYNKQLFQDEAESLRAAGLDPERPPATLDELDRYAAALDRVEVSGSSKTIKIAGYLPMEPGWFMDVTGYWFGATLFDDKAGTVLLDAAEMLAAMEWVRGYSLRLGADSMSQFQSGFGQVFNSVQHPFLAGIVAMEQQGPWMANFFDNIKPSVNRWHVPPEKLAREKAFAQLKVGMSFQDACAILGRPQEEGANSAACTWDAGIKMITVTFADGKATSLSMKLLPAAQRKQFCQWGAAPFPAANGKKDVTYAGFDILTIPKGAAHKKEAFEFIAYVNRQDVMEKLCSMHCKNSPLTKMSPGFLANHPNPYIDVYEQLAASPNARGIPPLPVWQQLHDDLALNAIQRVSRLTAKPSEALHEAQGRVQFAYERFVSRQQLRGLESPAKEAQP